MFSTLERFSTTEYAYCLHAAELLTTLHRVGWYPEPHFIIPALDNRDILHEYTCHYLIHQDLPTFMISTTCVNSIASVYLSSDKSDGRPETESTCPSGTGSGFGRWSPAAPGAALGLWASARSAAAAAAAAAGWAAVAGSSAGVLQSAVGPSAGSASSECSETMRLHVEYSPSGQDSYMARAKT